MQAPLDGKVVLVTGGAKRVGAAMCRRLHAAGAKIVIHFRSSDTDAKALASELGGAAALVQADLLKSGAGEKLVREAVKAFGRLDALVNNASSFYATPVGSITEKHWDDLMGTNLKAPLFISQAAARELRKARGAIVNIVDIHAELPMKEHVVYTAAKAGLVALTRSLARELAPEVRVNAVAPGTIMWPEGDVWRDDVTRQRIINRIALKRIGEPDDIAKAVEFLIGGAPFVTGQILAVDGGRSIVA